MVRKALEALENAKLRSVLDVKNALIKKIYSTEKVIEAFETIKQNNHESVHNFGKRFSETYERYTQKLNVRDSTEIEKIAKREFCNGLISANLKREATNREIDSKIALEQLVDTISTLTQYRGVS